MLRSSCARAFVLTLSLGLAAVVARDARADDPPEVVQARQDFREGVSLMAAEDWAGALAKFQKVARVKVNAQVAFNMAECEQHLGKWIAALGDYRLAAAKAADGSAPEVAAHVDERIADLEKKLPHLSIKKKEPTPNPKAHIELDGVEVQPTQLGKPVAADPGEHVVTVVIAGKTTATKKVTLAESANEFVEVAVPAPTEPGGGGTDPPPPSSGPSVPGIVMVSLGAASSVVGLAMIGLRQKAIGDLDDVCGGDSTCPTSAESIYEDGRTFTGVAEVTIPVGVVALTTGIILIATKKKTTAPAASDAPKSSWMVVPVVGGAEFGLSAVGTF